MKFVFCRGNPLLMEGLQKTFGASVMELGNFKDGETSIQVLENLRKKEVVVFQSLCSPANNNLSELLLVLSTLRRNGAARINVICPYLAYARMDRFVDKYRCIASSDVVNLIHATGCDELHLWDVHSDQVVGAVFGRMLIENHSCAHIVADLAKKEKLKEVVIVSPDLGGLKRAKKVVDVVKKNLGIPAELAIFDKTRTKANEVDSIELVRGSVEKRDCIIVDDMVDTGGTILEVATDIKKRGGNKVFAYATHGILSSPFFDKLSKSSLDKIFITDSYVRKPEDRHEKLEIISLIPTIKDVVDQLHH